MTNIGPQIVKIQQISPLVAKICKLGKKVIKQGMNNFVFAPLLTNLTYIFNYYPVYIICQCVLVFYKYMLIGVIAPPLSVKCKDSSMFSH